ncbi:NADH dehydrogenase [ubiquinone] 1 beta subcomplex subunit 4-like isoform X2 [Physeter macrocephalus]|uniref:NADH dehydrogenase [ubiquinone] 1 beta subcomplex subunit 4 n=1 Tax=Physeter macrocephalus TaxID=9755 RepID=A0A455AYP7_PHYMC|nr:NADH dehydrogenase [ubiquinone] 1 beta subcomplex subunit 4-like isoform X2 [Physeter catodon]XP_028341667.1 NADH dehydrogenase [ubiquinone] 1 beta subcomplex subunit 4-like isoform X2 [Physeter catodon]|eukprot:XP_028341666.1 NADH dehydrogenase [ubiquinone] 1 beta subcomplex subunit 4-like isoform X2 [Physeter catodon]
MTVLRRVCLGAVVRRVAETSIPKYKPLRLATLPTTLDPAEYDISPETRKAQAEGLAIRSRLKREYLLQYNIPSRHGVIEDPALIRWTYARSANIYPNFRPTPRTSLLGALFGIGPLLFWYYVFKTDRDRKEKLIREGKLDRTFNSSY